MAVLGYSQKLKGCGTSFWSHFQHDFSIKITDKVSMSYLFSFSRNQTKCVIKFLVRQLMTSNFKIYLGSTAKAMTDREKRGEDRNTKI